MKPGSIEVIIGPMFSGKSEELIRRLCLSQDENLQTRAFKHAADTRYSEQHIVSHSGLRFPAVAVASLPAPLFSISRDVHVLGIDEAHLFEDDLGKAVRAVANRGIRVIVAGLDLDYLGQPYAGMADLTGIADGLTRKTGICARCGAGSLFSQRIIASKERIVIGSEGIYEPRCRQCFIPGIDPGQSSVLAGPRDAHR